MNQKQLIALLQARAEKAERERDEARDEAMNERAERRTLEVSLKLWQESFRDVVHQRDRWERLRYEALPAVLGTWHPGNGRLSFAAQADNAEQVAKMAEHRKNGGGFVVVMTPPEST